MKYKIKKGWLPNVFWVEEKKKWGFITTWELLECFICKDETQLEAKAEAVVKEHLESRERWKKHKDIINKVYEIK